MCCQGTVALYALCSIPTYLLSLEARHTLRAEGKDSVTKGMPASAVGPWRDRCEGQPRPSSDCHA